MARRGQTTRVLLAGVAIAGLALLGGHTATRVLGQGAAGSVPAGAAVYLNQCAQCHGDALEGAGRFPALVGRHTVPNYPNAFVLYDYVLRSMPFNQPGTITADDALSVTAFMLNKNGLLADDAVLDAATLKSFRLPGADPIAPPVPNAPTTPQVVTPGSGQGGPVVGR